MQGLALASFPGSCLGVTSTRRWNRMNRRLTKVALSALALMLWGCTTPAPELGPATRGARSNWSTAMEAQRVALSQAMRNSGVSAVRNKDDQLQFNLPTDFAFDSDSADIKASMQEDLEQLAVSLNSPAAVRMRLLVVGYTDDQGSDAMNDPLSLARAHSVARQIQSKGVDARRITVEGRGERQPMVSNEQPYGRALNRRVEIVLSEPPAASSVDAPHD